MQKTRFLIGTLGAMALGVFCSCSSDEASDPYAQDRNISAIDLPEIDSLVLDSIETGRYPEELSGWELHWSKPFDSSGTRLYILGDSLSNDAQVDALQNGAGDFDFGSAGLHAPLAVLPVDDTIWRIPASLFAGKGRSGRGLDLRADTVFWFSVWVRYSDGAVGAPVRYRFYLGDEYPPEIPDVDTLIGQTSMRMEFDRPRDMSSRFDDDFKGRVDSIRAIWWKGTRIKDSALKDADGRPLCDTIHVPRDSIRDTSVHRFRLELGGLGYETRYMVLLQMFDSAGNRSSLGPFPVKTRDSRVPGSPSGGGAVAGSNNAATFSWAPATDSFADGSYQYANAPNHRLLDYRLLLSSPMGTPYRPVDSVDIASDSAAFHSGATWPASGSISRFSWNGSRWNWSWPNFTPGDSFRLAVLVRDASGNPAADTLFIDGATPAISGVTCRADRPLLPVKGSGVVDDFCIERFEHVDSDGQVAHDVSWKQAIDACEGDGGFLCSEAQWQRACETEPSSTRVHAYGTMEIGVDSDIDSTVWLREVCGVAGGRGDSGVAQDTAKRDPRCVSAWGVRDMPGQMAEWTRDVWFSRPDTLKESQLDSWSGAYLDTSDYTGKADHGTLRGGSWLDIGNTALSKTLSRCTSRTYAAFSVYDTLPNKTVVRKPNPDGKASSFGFRCCYKPL